MKMNGNGEELSMALAALEKEKNISRDLLLDAIENCLINACNNQFKHAENVKVDLDRETCNYEIYLEKTVVKDVMDDQYEIGVGDALALDANAKEGDIVKVQLDSKSFGRIASSAAKNLFTQKIREEERRAIYEQYIDKVHEVVTGVVQRQAGRDYIINLGKTDATLREKETMRKERLRPSDRIKVYVLDVRENTKSPKIYVSRTHPELVRKLFEFEVAEVKDKTVEIKSIARDAGERSKVAVYSTDENVDPVGACVGVNGDRVNSIVRELNGEKIDIINWDESPARFIENALRPAKVIYVVADEDERMAKVVVEDDQLSLAIGKEGQNARLAARLTGFKIDIKSETQAKELGEFIGYDESDYEDYNDDYEDYEDYDEEYDDSYSEEVYEDSYEEGSDQNGEDASLDE